MIPSDKTKQQLPQGFWILLGLVLFLASSCNRSVYLPNEAYYMGISQKGDLKVSGGFLSSKDSYRQYSFGGAYSPVKHLSVVASHANIGGDYDVFGLNTWRVNMNEVALGFYKKTISKKADNQYFLYDAYAGMGWGKVVYDFVDKGKMDLFFRRQFLQNNLHFWLSPHFGVSFGIRITRLHYLNADLFGAIPSEQSSLINFVRINDPFYSIEPSLQYTAGNQQFKCFVSLTGLGHTKKDAYAFGQNNRLGEGLIKLGLILELDDIYDWAKKLKVVR